MRTLSVADGYAKWAPTYHEPGNSLIRSEMECLSEVLADLSPASVLDVGTGTGRHALAFAQQGATVVGVDASPAMLAIAERKRQGLGLSNVRFVEGAMDSALPVLAATFDLAICALTLCHVPDLERAIALLVRAVRPGGHVVITDLHPGAVAAGLCTLFEVGTAEFAIATSSHSLSGYLDALHSEGASVVLLEERCLGEAMASATGLPPRVAESNWQELPFCLVVVARRPEKTSA